MVLCKYIYEGELVHDTHWEFMQEDTHVSINGDVLKFLWHLSVGSSSASDIQGHLPASSVLVLSRFSKLAMLGFSQP